MRLFQIFSNTVSSVCSYALERLSFLTLLKISPFPAFFRNCASSTVNHCNIFDFFNLSFSGFFLYKKNLHFRLKNFSLIFTNFRNVLDTTNATNYKLLAHPKYFWQKQIKYFFFEILQSSRILCRGSFKYSMECYAILNFSRLF